MEKIKLNAIGTGTGITKVLVLVKSILTYSKSGDARRPSQPATTPDFGIRKKYFGIQNNTEPTIGEK